MNWTRRDAVGLLAVVAVLFVVANAVAFLFIRHQFGTAGEPRYESLKQRLKKDTTKRTIPHPFYGFAIEGAAPLPKNPISTEPLFDSISIAGSARPIRVLVLGGSVASHLSNGGTTGQTHLLADRLNRHFATDRFVVFNAAMAGAKQPQQYFKWLYLDLLGFKPEIVLNLDGFNEIALPVGENLPLDVPAIFPRAWSRLLHATSADRACAERSNRMLDAQYRLPLAELAMWAYVGYCHHAIEGPAQHRAWWTEAMGSSGDRPDVVGQSIEIWRTATNRLHDHLSMRGIDYIHVLQPNQYLDGSKPLSDEEKKHFLDRPVYGDPIHAHYPKLQFRDTDVENVIDQRMLFREVASTVYSDNCCHFNERGLAMIVDDIVAKQETVFRKHLDERRR